MGSNGLARADVRRLAVVSYHSSPLVEPGSGDSGGMTIYVRALAEAMASRGVSTDVFTRANGNTPRISELSPGVRVMGVEAGPHSPASKEELSRYVKDFAWGTRALATLQGSHYDVIHSHYWQSGLAAGALAKAWDAPLVHSHHTLGLVKNRFLAPGDVQEPEARLRGEAEVIDMADVLLASTEEEQHYLACLYGASHDRLKTLSPGVDHRLFSPGDRVEARAALGLGDEPVILYVGRIQRLKGIDLAIRAFKELSHVIAPTEAKFLIVGGASGPDGEDEVQRLTDLARSLGIEGRVCFLGPRPHADLPTYYRAADALVVCSHYESFGLAALEAQASGTPVVATAVGGLSYIVKDGESGFLLDTRDPSAFAARIATLLNDPMLLASFGFEGVRRARSFSWRRTADELLDLYECLVDERLPEVCVC
jgi:D-inositol-3-phosphate glycosyltransferase